MGWKQQIGGMIALAAMVAAGGIAGWWFMTRGVVIDRADLMSKSREESGRVGPLPSSIGVGGQLDGAWELGPDDLDPADNPISFTAILKTSGDMAVRRPVFTLAASLVDESGAEVWSGHAESRWKKRNVEARRHSSSFELGMTQIDDPGQYTLYCDIQERGTQGQGIGGGADLNMVVRKQAKAFPFVPFIASIGVCMLAGILSGKRVQNRSEMVSKIPGASELGLEQLLDREKRS